MTAANYLMKAQDSLDSLEQVLRAAAEERWPPGEIVERAMVHLAEARQIIASLADEEGTE